MQRKVAPIDFLSYVRAIGLLFKYPIIILAPFAASLADIVVRMLLTPSEAGPLGSINGLLAQLLIALIDGFGLGVALISADTAWRGRKVSFEAAFDEARRKAPEIFLAAIGFNFVIAAAALVGGALGGFGSIALAAIAFFFFMYTLPAAAIGGVPGFAALQVSIDYVKANYLAALALFFVGSVVYFFVALILVSSYLPVLISGFEGASYVAQILGALVHAIALSYIALVLAKTYSDVVFEGRRM